MTQENSVSMEDQAQILHREESKASPWVTLVGKTVDFGTGHAPEVYHCISQSNYVGILAQTPDNKVVLVRQFRPAVERYVWELPAWLLEKDETPETCCRRELLEEAGVHTESVVDLGTLYPDTGRLQNRMHSFFARTSYPDPNITTEAGIEVDFVAPRELHDLVTRGDFPHMLHVGVLSLAAMRGLWQFT